MNNEQRSPKPDSQPSAFHLELRSDNIGVITIDVSGDKVNTLKAEFVEQVNDVLLKAQQCTQLAGLVILSGKADSFIAGADISMISACRCAQEAEALAQKGQTTLAQIAAFPVPVVAAIHGACLGGGLELALACHGRVCSSDDKTVLGLPEVQLGLLPGSGGTQRLPGLIGARYALEMMLTGKRISARKAKQIGLVDEVVPHSILLQVAIERVKQGKQPRRALVWRERFLNSVLGRALLFNRIQKQTMAKTRGHYPAAERIIQVVRAGLDHGNSYGYQEEARAFGELAMSPQSAALRSLFFATTALKNEGYAGTQALPLQQIGVLGGGLMGAGIACITATRAELPVRIKDVSEEGVNHALGFTWAWLNKRVRRKRLSVSESQKKMMLLSGTTDHCGFERADLVIEAVFEDLALKQQMVADIEHHAAPHTLFASNTSSLPISQIAAKAARPEQIIGLHYFSPVDKMPLVEVIPHATTSEQTIATTLQLAQRQGKTAIIVADRAGFYVNRILAPYINEAARCLLAGEPIESIDNALVNFGFPVGPIMLLDEVGIDVGTKIIPILTAEFGSRFAAPAAFDAILKDGRKGRKNGRGFYLYSDRQKHKCADQTVYSLLGITATAHIQPAVLVQRCVMLMLNEAARCLDEGVIRSARDGDIGAVFGIGFPPFLGGPFRYMDQLGAEKMVKTLQHLHKQYGEHFAPCARLQEMAQKRENFYPPVRSSAN